MKSLSFVSFSCFFLYGISPREKYSWVIVILKNYTDRIIFFLLIVICFQLLFFSCFNSFSLFIKDTVAQNVAFVSNPLLIWEFLSSTIYGTTYSLCLLPLSYKKYNKIIERLPFSILNLSSSTLNTAVRLSHDAVNRDLIKTLKSELNTNVELVYDNLNSISTIKEISINLQNVSIVYAFRCKLTKDLYIGSTENGAKRFKEHLSGKKSNVILQRAINKYGISEFQFLVIEYFQVKDDLKGAISLLLLEDKYLTLLKPKYNIRVSATSMKGYKHTEEAIDKMKKHLLENSHPMLGKKHTEEAKIKISEKVAGINNPMFGNKHKEISKKLIGLSKERSVYIFNKNGSFFKEIAHSTASKTAI